MIALSLDETVRAVGGRMPVPCEPFGVTGLSTDTRSLKPGDLFVALSGENFDGHAFVAEAFAKGACAALVAKSAQKRLGLADVRTAPLILVDDTRLALGRLAAHHRRELSAKVIAVTGSNGKTTTKGMIHHVLSACLPGRAADKSFNNDVGVPLTLLSAGSADRYLVVEIGSSAPGEVAPLAAMASPDVGVVTSIGHAHLEGFGSIEAVAREKLSLLDHLAPGGLAVVNLDDLEGHARLGTGLPSRERKRPVDQPRACAWGSENRHLAASGERAAIGADLCPGSSRAISYGTDPRADVRVTDLKCRFDGVDFTINGRYPVRLPVPGEHNARNAAAVFAVARRMELEPERIVEALATVELPEMRLHVRRLNGVTVIEDCYNANPTSMAAGIGVLCAVQEGRRVLVAGEMKELGGETGVLHERIGALAARSGVDLVVSVGRGAAPVVDGVRSLDPGVTVHTCASTEQACAEVPPMLAEGDTVLIKGSRAMGLERLTQEIIERFSAVSSARE